MTSSRNLACGSFLITLIFSLSQVQAGSLKSKPSLGQLQIGGISTNYDSDKKIFSANGKAVATISGQDSKLTANRIRYHQNSHILEASGSAQLIRRGQLRTANSFVFDITSPGYLVTDVLTKITDPSGLIVDAYEPSKFKLTQKFCSHQQ